MKTTAFGLIVLFVFFSTSTQAREFHELQFPDQVTLPDSDVALQLNGIGFRTKFFMKIYIAALYTESRAESRDAVLAQSGPKRLLMHFIYDEISQEKLAAAWREGFEDNLDKSNLQLLSTRIDAFNNMFTAVHSGDVVLLDYVPGKGTTVTIRGEKKGVIEGADFNNALLDIWLGEDPADGDLKEGLLKYFVRE